MKNQTGKSKRTPSLTTTLALAYFGVSVFALLLSSVVQIALNIRAQQAALSNKQLLIAQDASKSVSGFVQDKFSSLETAVDFANPFNSTTEVQKNIMESLLGIHPSFTQMALLDLQGRKMSLAGRSSQALSPQFSDHLQEETVLQALAEKRYISPVYIDDATNEPLIAIAIPVMDVLGNAQGVLVAEVNLKFMWDLVDQLQVGSTGYAYVVDEKGDLIAYKDATLVLGNQNLKNIYEVKKFIQDSTLPTNAAPGLETYIGLTGDTVVGIYVPLETPQWAVVIELPRREAYQDITALIFQSLVIILGIALLAGLIGSSGARFSARPLIALSNVANEVAKGNMGIKAEVGGPAEITNLAVAFNSMTSQLNDMISLLEQRVEQRTAVAETARAEAEIASAEAKSASKNLETQMWLATGQTQLEDAMRGELGVSQLAENVISQLCQYMGAQAGALFLSNGKTLTLAGRYAFTKRPGFEDKFQLGEGLVGQAAMDGEVFHLKDIPSETLVISTGLADVKPREVIAFPFHANGEVVGIVELATLSAFTQAHFGLLKRLSESIGVAFRTAETRNRLAELLIESQSQSEELQAQEEELRAANEELHAQAENLRNVRDFKPRKGGA